MTFIIALSALILRNSVRSLKKSVCLSVQDQVWNRVTVNRSEGKATRYYIDEFHLLLKEEQTAAYSVEIWKRFRKWGGIPTGITQNVKDLLTSREVSNVFENSDFVYMLNQAQGDREMILSRLVDTFFSRISLTMQPPPKPHSTACVLPWEEGRHCRADPPVVPVAEEVSPDKYL